MCTWKSFPQEISLSCIAINKYISQQWKLEISHNDHIMKAKIIFSWLFETQLYHKSKVNSVSITLINLVMFQSKEHVNIAVWRMCIYEQYTCAGEI